MRPGYTLTGYLIEVFRISCSNYIWELLGNYPVFTMVMVIFRYDKIIGELLLPPIFHKTYTIIKNIIQVNQLIFIYDHS